MFEDGKGPLCQHVYGPAIDAIVEAEFLQHIAELDQEWLDQEIAARSGDHPGEERHLRQHVRKAEADAREAERLFRRFAGGDEADPRGKTLYDDWGAALARLKTLHAQQAAMITQRPKPFSADELATLSALRTDFATVWHSPLTTNQERKLLVRDAIEWVWLLYNTKVRCKFVIQWKGGLETPHEFFQPRGGALLTRRAAARGMRAEAIYAGLATRGMTLRERHPLTLAGVRACVRNVARRAGSAPWAQRRLSLKAPLMELTRKGWDDQEIAEEFGRRKYLTSARTTDWTINKVYHLRRQLGIGRPLTATALARRAARRGLSAETIFAGLEARSHRLRGPSLTLAAVHTLVRAVAPAQAVAPWCARRLALREHLVTLVSRGWNDSRIAKEFERCEFRTARYTTTWTRLQIRHLRQIFGVACPGSAKLARRAARRGMSAKAIFAGFQKRGRTLLADVPLTMQAVRGLVMRVARKAGIRTWLERRKELLPPLKDLVIAGWDNHRIAEEFRRRRYLTTSRTTNWTAGKIAHLRRQLNAVPTGVPARPAA
jgi:hypothetical protein